MNPLPFDWCRCQGENCDKRDTCQRYRDRDVMGPRTPWTDRLCPDNNTSEGYIAVREEAKQ